MATAWTLFILFILALLLLLFNFVKEAYLKRWYYSREYLISLALIIVGLAGMMYTVSLSANTTHTGFFAGLCALSALSQSGLNLVNRKKEREMALKFEAFKQSLGPRLKQIPMLDPKEIEGLTEEETKTVVNKFFEKEQATIERFNDEFEAALPDSLKGYRDLLILRLRRKVRWKKFFHRKAEVQDLM
jgi:hypothetical protein